jgi:hypothetical protein
MKKYMVGFAAALVAIVLSSFTSGAFEKRNETSKHPGNYHWYDFNGNNSVQMSNPKKYSLDEDDSPDCFPRTGSIYCEIFAEGEEEPDLSTIVNNRMRP